MALSPGIISLILFSLLFLGFIFTKLRSWVITSIVLLLAFVSAWLVLAIPTPALLGASFDGLLLALIPIIWVILAAVFSYLVIEKAGGMQVIKEFLMQMTKHKNIQVILIAFGFGAFLEAVAGFGTSVVIPAIMLTTIGVPALRATVLALIANSVPVAFGALGIPVLVLSQITELSLQTLTTYVALQLLPFCVFIPLALLFISNDGKMPSKAEIQDALLIGFLFSLGQTLVAMFIGPELAAASGALLALFGFFAISRLRSRIFSSTPHASSLRKRKHFDFTLFSLVNAASPYLILLVLVLATKLVFKEAFANVFFMVGNYKVDYLTTPGTLLFLATLLAAALQRLPWHILFQSAKETLHKIAGSAVTIITLVILSKIMAVSGMVAGLALLVTGTVGVFYPFFAPLIGALGTFLTGSDTSSNILFGRLQVAAATSLQANEAWLAAANTSGATAGKMISPQSIALGASATGIATQEKAIFRSTALFCLGYGALLGLYVGLVSWFFL